VESLEPLKEAAQQAPHMLPQMLRELKAVDPQAMLLVMPFVMAELESQPSMLRALSAVLQEA